MSKAILIVEDETAIATNLAYALATDGFLPQHVTLGQAALDILTAADANMPALIVLDVGLPDISGFDVCRRLRQFSNTPVIFLTSRGDEIDRVVGLEIGADDYVTKPFSPRELVARIRAVLRRLQAAPNVAQANPLPLGTEMPVPNEAALIDSKARTSASEVNQTNTKPGLELRTDEGRIVYCGQSLNLTRYEYLLLKTLIEHPGHLLSRAQLMDMVWTNAPETLERTVDAHIKSVRAKLRQIAPDELIQTHRGMGYSLSL